MAFGVNVPVLYELVAHASVQCKVYDCPGVPPEERIHAQLIFHCHPSVVELCSYCVSVCFVGPDVRCIGGYDGLVAIPPWVMAVEVPGDVCVGDGVVVLNFLSNVSGLAWGVYVEEVEFLVVDCNCHFI